MNSLKRAVVAADHAGFPLKEEIKQHLAGLGYDVIDSGTFSEESVDYPAIMRQGCAAALEHDCLAFIFGGSGNGEAMAANKVPGIRCAVVYSDDTARLAREHNNANAMSMGARLTNTDDAKRFVDIFLNSEYEGGRHDARINDLDAEFNT